MKKKTTKKAAKKVTTKSKSAPGRSSSAKSSKSAKNEGDILQIILQDHKPLKEMIETLKDEDVEFAEKRPVFEQFAPMLLSHAEPEEETLYAAMREEDELRVESFEGDTEHTIANQLIEEIKNITEEDEWMAKVKVLAEMVEHHIEEEEEEMFKDIRKEIDAETRVELGAEYTRLRDEMRMENSVPAAKSSKKTSEARVH